MRGAAAAGRHVAVSAAVRRVGAMALGLAIVSLTVIGAEAGRISDIRNTRHNFSTSGPGVVRAVSEDELCVFCHTPHGASQAAVTPLWNRSLSGATYTPYASSSMDAIGLDQPGGSSKLCLSCHDGTIAIGAVNVLNGAVTDQDPTTPDISLTGTAPGGTIPVGAGAATGFTRRLGTDLTNDHPVSFTYSDGLALNDGELVLPSTAAHIDSRIPGVHPDLPLENDQLQCTSCHDPHIRDTLEPEIKFLRLNRFQQAEPAGGSFSKNNDILCLGCHDKDGWVGSAHASSFVADETYASTAATLREFPLNLQVWRAACLNCHDPHSVQGSRRLLREATDSLATPKSGGNSAVEEGCYQCHSATGNTLNNQGGASFAVPDVAVDFNSLRHMPIAEQPEVHDIGTGGLAQAGKDLIESQALLGKPNAQNRHVECTDCHNPHRAIKNRLFNESPITADPAGSHTHEATTLHTNLASGVLKGTWGVEPNYGSSSFLSVPSSYTVKRGNPSVGASTDHSSPWVTREYQVCLKCHSDYGYDLPPDLGVGAGSTPVGTNGLTRYTNQAMEFQAPLSDRGELSADHRSWHPVIGPTDRTTAIRQADANNFLAPWNNPTFIGTQTMYCSDCHGSETAPGTSTPSGGENGRSWGPHGSIHDFILKGAWNDQTGGPGTEDHLCFKCHSFQRYATRDGRNFATGFSDSGGENFHALHADRIGRNRCTWCHVAVPHGWKNKAFLVDLNNVGPEAGLPTGTQVRNNTTAGYTQEPYYLNALNKIRTFATSGNWQAADCGSAGPPGNGQLGGDWMGGGTENCANPP
jgi:hypothetical protein